MRAVEVEKTIEIPQNIGLKLDGKKVTVVGEKGELTRDFSHAPVSLMKKGDLIRVRTEWPRKREAAIVGTVASHIENMITGATVGFTHRMKIVFSHFPISVKVTDRKVVIENFTGERAPRVARILGDVAVSVDADDVIIQGIDLESVSQTAANIEQATKVKVKDPRVFLDGIYVYKRHEGMEA